MVIWNGFFSPKSDSNALKKKKCSEKKKKKKFKSNEIHSDILVSEFPPISRETELSRVYGIWISHQNYIIIKLLSIYIYNKLSEYRI